MIRVRVRGRNPTPGTIQTSPFALDVLELADTFFRTSLRLSMVAGCQEAVVARGHDESDLVLLLDTSQ